MNTVRRWRAGNLAVLAVALLMSSGCTPKKPYNEIIAAYSDVCVNPESGDLGGHQLLILDPAYYLNRTSDDAGPRYAIFEVAQSDFLEPYIGAATYQGVKLRIEFLDFPHTPKLIFAGEITPKLVSGTFSDGRTNELGDPVFRLPRRSVRETAVPPCSESAGEP